ncbi:MAG: NUMOD3 domain-containing DNA-binding protein [Lutibacter sp.]|jgi:hypothetical protein
MIKGSKQTPEAKKKMSEAKKGIYVPWNKGMKMLDEYIQKNRQGHIGLVQTDETKLKRSNALKGKKKPNRKPFDEDYKKWMSEQRKGKKKSEEWKQKMRVLWSIPENKQKLIDVGKKHWEDPEYCDMILKSIYLGMKVHPNKPETIIGNLLDEMYPDEWEFVGDFKIKYERKCPDFKHKVKNLVIEHFGIYPHGDLIEDKLDEKYVNTEQGRIEFFAKHNLKTLIIWDVELYNQLEIVKWRIKKFVEENID